ncbi:type III polyketide synthase [Paenibacillus sp. PL2-23]|uniref:type III polyketide synthase n=1 Tax=Paenibacillus sp. PL2-23 TaxID=2100729 RepID=UPI0030F889B2
MNTGREIAAIWGIGTAVPPYRMDQEDTSRRLVEALAGAGHTDSSRWAKRIFKQCGVDSRYTCEPNLLEEADDCRYFKGPELGGGLVPTTGERMAVYKQACVPLAVEAARAALADGGTEAESVTHLITVSCTGQFLPGLDAVLIRELGLRETAARYPLTFLGCAAGLKAIALAKGMVSAQPQARVLIVCVELCTLHIQPSGGREALYGASFFGDGASACVVGAAESRGRDNSCFLLGEERTVLLEGSEGEMVWEIGDHGFDLYLSTSIPRLIGEHVPAQVERLLEGAAKPDLWAIHPGGRGIVDILQELFGLTEEQTSASRSILRNYGNMSSATILFVLAEMKRELEASRAPVREGVALAFGPGVTAEMLRIAYAPPAHGHANSSFTLAEEAHA